MNSASGNPNGSGTGSNRGSSFWSEIRRGGGGEEEEEVSRKHRPPTLPAPLGAAVYRRRTLREPSNGAAPSTSGATSRRRVSFAHGKRCSFTGLSTRGRVSLAVGDDFRPPNKQIGGKKIPRPCPRAKGGEKGRPDFALEKAYFCEVDSLELLEESPSPKHFSTWALGRQHDYIMDDLNAILARWRISKRASNYLSSLSRQPLFNILETPSVPSAQSNNYGSDPYKEGRMQGCTKSQQESLNSRVSADPNLSSSVHNEDSIAVSLAELRLKDVGVEDCSSKTINELRKGDSGDRLDGVIGKGLVNLHLALPVGGILSAFGQLLMVCEQSVPIRLVEVFSKYCEPGSVVKIGEGTYGEAFRAGETVCKVVPIDGSILVNGEVQKKSEEVLEEVLLSLTLNNLREPQTEAEKQNFCTCFIETKDFQVCQGSYGSTLINAWEDWDVKFQSENDHPKEFPEEQLYIVFVLADGGKDLEGFVLQDIAEARSLLVQVTAALAVAEAACEFEHRDMHWGNILLARKETTWAEYTIEGRKLRLTTHGIVISIIDFTLSRINTGKAIHFLDLSSDPAIFEGPKGDRQSETYRKMKEITEDCWEGSFPKTNVLWLMYLVDILLTKKRFKRTTKDERELRSLKKRMDSYGSAGECLADGYFSDLISENSS